MVSCLALIHHTHALIGHEAELNYTACGLSIADRYVEQNLFAVDAKTATCEQCRNALDAATRSAPSTAPPSDPKWLVTQLIEQVLNTNNVDALTTVMKGKLSIEFAPQRLQRLHQLFPTWHATIDELIAEGNSVVVRYHVAYSDAFALLGPVGPAIKRNQAAVFRLVEHCLVAVSAIVDDFAIWDALSNPDHPSNECSCHPLTEPAARAVPELITLPS